MWRSSWLRHRAEGQPRTGRWLRVCLLGGLGVGTLGWREGKSEWGRWKRHKGRRTSAESPLLPGVGSLL